MCAGTKSVPHQRLLEAIFDCVCYLRLYLTTPRGCLRSYLTVCAGNPHQRLLEVVFDRVLLLGSVEGILNREQLLHIGGLLLVGYAELARGRQCL